MFVYGCALAVALAFTHELAKRHINRQCQPSFSIQLHDITHTIHHEPPVGGLAVFYGLDN